MSPPAFFGESVTGILFAIGTAFFTALITAIVRFFRTRLKEDEERSKDLLLIISAYGTVALFIAWVAVLLTSVAFIGAYEPSERERYLSATQDRLNQYETIVYATQTAITNIIQATIAPTQYPEEYFETALAQTLTLLAMTPPPP
jgi:hypothetical protein